MKVNFHFEFASFLSLLTNKVVVVTSRPRSSLSLKLSAYAFVISWLVHVISHS